MRQKIKKFLLLLLVTVFSLSINLTPVTAFADSNPTIRARAYVQKLGWMDWNSGDVTIGTTGKSLRAEAFQVNIAGDSNLGVQYCAHVQSKGWLPWVSDGDVEGTMCKSLRMEAIKIKLTGTDAANYDIFYRVHAQHFGWLDWTSNGESAGTSGLAYRIEAIQIKLVKKPDENAYYIEAPFKGNFATPYVSKTRVGRVNIKNSKVTLNRAKIVSDSFNKLPYGVLWSFDRLKFGIDIGCYNKDWAGLFSSLDRKVYIENNTSMNLSVVTWHELGHFVDLLLNLDHETYDFEKVYNKERTNLVPMYKANYNYYISNIGEYFAECFAQIYYNPNQIKKSCPETYNYLCKRLEFLTQYSVDYIGERLNRYNKEHGKLSCAYAFTSRD